MVVNPTTRARLCPKCANSIKEDATNCSYCKAELGADYIPEWLKRDEQTSEPRVGLISKKKFPIVSKFIWPAAMVVAALLAFFAGAYRQRSELSLASQANLKKLQATDQIIQNSGSPACRNAQTIERQLQSTYRAEDQTRGKPKGTCGSPATTGSRHS